MRCRTAGVWKNGWQRIWRIRWKPFRRQEDVQGNLLGLRAGVRSSFRTFAWKACVLQGLLPEAQKAQELLRRKKGFLEGKGRNALFPFFFLFFFQSRRFNAFSCSPWLRISSFTPEKRFTFREKVSACLSRRLAGFSGPKPGCVGKTRRWETLRW